MRAVKIHSPEIEVAGRERSVNDLLVFPIDCCFGVIAGSVGQPLERTAIVVSFKDVVARIDGPDVAFAAISCWRAGVAGEMCGGVDDMFPIGEEVAAGSSAFSGGDHVLPGAIGVHDEDLVALQCATRRLKDQPCSTGRPISFGVLTARG